MDDSARNESSTPALARIRALENELERAIEWARAPLVEAEALIPALSELHAAGVPSSKLRVWVWRALHRMPKGEAGPVPPHVQDVLARLNRVGQGLAEISSRAREASKRALQLALDVHGMVADAQRELESMPASAQRDAALLEVVHLPIHLRRRAQEVRDESVRLPVRSYEMRAQLQRTVSRRTLGRRRTIPLPPLR